MNSREEIIEDYREVLNTWNKFAPLSFKYDMKWVKQFFMNKDSNYIKDMERKYGK